MGRFSGRAEIPEGAEMRLDRYAAECLKLFSRSRLKSRRAEAKLNGKPVKLSKPVKDGDLLELIWHDEPLSVLEGEDIPLDVLYEDNRVIVVNKKPGMVVHPGAGNRRGTLANALRFRRPSAQAYSGEGENVRAGIVHRLDKDTSGVIIAAWDGDALDFLAAQFRARTLTKRYLALVQGIPPERGIINAPIGRDTKNRKRFTAALSGGKPALTAYRLLRIFNGYSLVALRPKTGRTHQIRVHLASIGHPVAGDPLYGRPHPLGLMLHAYSLEIILPGQGEASLFKAPVPERFRAFWAQTRKGG